MAKLMQNLHQLCDNLQAGEAEDKSLYCTDV